MINIYIIAFQRSLYNTLKNRELNITIGQEAGKSALKNVNFQLKSKNSAQNLSLSINNNISKVENVDKVSSNYKLVYNYPVHENFKIKVI